MIIVIGRRGGWKEEESVHVGRGVQTERGKGGE